MKKKKLTFYADYDQAYSKLFYTWKDFYHYLGDDNEDYYGYE